MKFVIVKNQSNNDAQSFSKFALTRSTNNFAIYHFNTVH